MNHRGSSFSAKHWRHRHTGAHLAIKVEQTLRRHAHQFSLRRHAHQFSQLQILQRSSSPTVLRVEREVEAKWILLTDTFTVLHVGWFSMPQMRD
jgi:hypothetical protein